MRRASEVLNEMTGAEDRQTVSEADCRTNCPVCGTEHRLSDAEVEVSDDGLETTYLCRKGHGALLIVSTPGAVPWEGRGYRVGDWVIRNPRDLFVAIPGKAGGFRFPESPHALD